jgi:hypothetical protein
VGDYVLAYDEATDTIGYYPISAIWMHEDPLVLYLVIDGELIETTPDHPFYTMDGEWVAAGELQSGDRIRQADGSYGTVEAIQFVYQLQPMYNLTVASAHTFFVGDGHWLVHNSCLDDFLSKVTDGRGRNVGHYKGTVADADEIFHKLIDPGTFTWDPQARLFYGYTPGGLRVNLRPVSRSGPPTIDLNKHFEAGLSNWRKVKFIQ